MAWCPHDSGILLSAGKDGCVFGWNVEEDAKPDVSLLDFLNHLFIDTDQNEHSRVILHVGNFFAACIERMAVRSYVVS